ncbi:MAG: hypothetical protein WA828_20175 [Coleofasciculaceae cyanobacterium]
MNIQKSRLLEDSNNTSTFSKLTNHSATNIKSSTQALKNIVAERKKGGNKLLFGFTVAVLTTIMGGSIFFAINQYQPPDTSELFIVE